jgi:glycosyltransferase involved in cell wall biosynthesis
MLTGHKKITIVVPNYNHGTYIDFALKAIFEQTRAADEVILIDDASTDDSLSKMMDWRDRGAPSTSIRIIQNDRRGGVVAAMNRGLEEAEGDLVAFLAADDLVHPEFLRKAAAALDQVREAPFCSAMVTLQYLNKTIVGGRPIIRPARIPRFIPADEVRSMLRRADNFFLGPASLYRREALRDLGGFDANLGSFADSMAQRLLAAQRGFFFVPEPLAIWRLHGENYSVRSTIDSTVFEKHLQAVTEFVSRVQLGVFPPDYPRLLVRRLRFNAARLQIFEQSLSRSRKLDVVNATIAGTAADRSALRLASSLGPAANLASLAWISLKLRPFSMRWLAGDWFLRWLGR